MGRILDNPKAFLESLSSTEFKQMLDKFGFEYEDISNCSEELKVIKKYMHSLQINKFKNNICSHIDCKRLVNDEKVIDKGDNKYSNCNLNGVNRWLKANKNKIEINNKDMNNNYEQCRKNSKDLEAA